MSTTKVLGTLETRVRRAAATAPGLGVGDAVEIARDPGDRRSTTAIRVIHVIGGRRRTVGRLPRTVAHWLAGLMDRGWVEVEGAVSGDPDRRWLPLELTFRVTGRGSHILEAAADDPAPAEELHARVLSHWPPRTRAAREALGTIREEIEAGTAGPVLPETRLLLAIAAAARRRGARRSPARFPASVPVDRGFVLDGFHIGQPVTAGNLALFPVHLEKDTAPDVVSFDVAHARGHVTVTEIDRGGNVNELRVRNGGPSAVLLPQGLVLVGGKQDRMVAIPLLILPGQKRTVPVNCVEAGRWNWESGRMAPRRVATPSMRSKVANVLPQNVHAMQIAMWDDVRSISTVYESASETEAMDELYEQVDTGDAEVLLEGLPAGASGLVAAVGGRFMGCDLFGAPRLLTPMRHRIVESWVVEAGMRPWDAGEPPEPRELEVLLTRATAAATPSGEETGDGVTRLVIDGREVRGTVLLRERSLLHMSLFPAN